MNTTKFASALKDSAIQTISSTAAQSAITGDSFKDALKLQLTNLVINASGQLIANEIGNLAHETKIIDTQGNQVATIAPQISKPTQLTLHAALGCGMAAAAGNNCAAGAAAGVVGELSAEILDRNTSLNNKQILESVKLISALAAATVAGPDDGASVFAGSQIGRNAAENNYQKDVHKYLTQYLAENAGFSEEEAEKIAEGNQGMDEYEHTNPLTIVGGERARELYHFTTKERREELKRIAYDSKNPKVFGNYLHALQDSYSHQMDGVPYGAQYGHIYDGTTPDRTYERPYLADIMTEKTDQELRLFLIHIGGTPIGSFEDSRTTIQQFNRLKIKDENEKGQSLFK